MAAMTGWNDETVDAPEVPDAAGGSAWPAGTRLLDTYEITGPPRHGGMGIVHPARHLGWDIPIAIKSPRPHLLRRAEDRDGFVREARTWMGLGLHPHVCTCHYVRSVDGFPRVFAEFVDGDSLDDLMRGDPPPLYQGTAPDVLARMLDIAVQAAWGLEHAHTRGVVHRDVKPGNILVGADGQVRVADFGLSQAPPGRRGTRLYRSPEQADGRTSGPTTDVWSFAATVLAMFSGEATWRDGAAAGAALTAVRDGELPPRARSLPEEVTQALVHSLCTDPEDRAPDLTELTAALVTAYERVAEAPPARQRPKAAQLRAGELNNRALSLRDLGETDETEVRRLLGEALRVDPRHPEALYNLGMLRWRAAETTPGVIRRDLDGAGDDGGERVRQLVELVDAERGDAPARHTLNSVDHGPASGTVICLVPGGTRVVTADAVGRLLVWDIAGGRRTAILDGHAPHAIERVHASRDGRHILTVGADRHVRLWDLETGTCLWRKRHPGPVDAELIVSPDLHGALVRDPVGDPHRIGWWRPGGPRRVRRLATRARVTATLALDAQTVAIAEDGGLVGVWDCTRLRGRALRHSVTIGLLAADSDGRRLVTTAHSHDDSAAWVWDPRAAECLHRLGGHTAPIGAIAVGEGGRLALTGSGDSTARLWDLDTGRCLHVLAGHTGIVQAVGLPHGDAPRAVTIELTGTVRVWDTENGRCLNEFRSPEWTSAARAELTPDGGHLLVPGKGTVAVHRLEPRPTPSPLQVCRPRSALSAATAESQVAALAADADRALTEGRTVDALALIRRARAVPGHERSPKLMAVWRRAADAARPTGVRSAWYVRALDGGDGQLTDVCAAGRFVLSAGHADHAVWIWDIRGERVGRLTGHTDRVFTVDATPDGRRAVTGAADHTVRIWRLDARGSATECHVLTGHDAPVMAARLTPDGRRAVTGDQNGGIRVWEFDSGACVHTLTGHVGRITSLSVTPDGRYALSAGPGDSGVRQWDLATGRLAHVPETVPGAGPQSMCVTPNGLLITVCRRTPDGIRVRSLEDRRLVGKLDAAHPAGTMVRAVFPVPVGEFVITAGTDHVLTICEAASGRTVGRLEGHATDVAAVTMSADWQYVLAAGFDGDVHVWAVDWELRVP